jgi:hypothetical protein
MIMFSKFELIKTLPPPTNKSTNVVQSLGKQENNYSNYGYLEPV